MILNILILIFLLLMVAWYSGQGLYTGLLHLLLTVFSGALALALWEPIVQGLLLDVLPEQAWGVGLLVLFALLLYGLRYLFDRLMIGNQDFPDMANKVGGGVAGLLSGILTAGIGIMGLQMSGMPAVLGYQGWEVENGRPAQSQELWVQVDAMTANFFERIGGGALHPIGSDQGMSRVHPNLAAESSFFAQAAFDLSRRSIRPNNLGLVRDGYFTVSEPPDKLASKLTRSGRVVVVGTEVTLQPSEGGGAADEDAVFRVSRKQVALLCAEEGGGAEIHLPVGYIQNGEFGSMAREGEYAYSNPSVPSVRHHWVFQMPGGCEPAYLRLKQVRLPVSGEPIREPAELAQLMSRGGAAQADGGDGDGGESGDMDQPSPREGGVPGSDAEMISIDDDLPFIINKNALASDNVEIIDGAIRAGNATVTKGDRPGSNLAVDTIYSAQTARIVKVDLGSPDQPDSLLGKVMGFARQNTQAPNLVDSQGRNYFAMGYGIVSRGEFVFDINPNRPLRSLGKVNLGNIREDERLVLYFQIAQGTRLTEFRVGQSQSQSINLTVE